MSPSSASTHLLKTYRDGGSTASQCPTTLSVKRFFLISHLVSIILGIGGSGWEGSGETKRVEALKVSGFVLGAERFRWPRWALLRPRHGHPQGGATTGSSPQPEAVTRALHSAPTHTGFAALESQYALLHRQVAGKGVRTLCSLHVLGDAVTPPGVAQGVCVHREPCAPASGAFSKHSPACDLGCFGVGRLAHLSVTHLPGFGELFCLSTEKNIIF